MRIPATRLGATTGRLRDISERLQGRYRVPDAFPRLSIVIVAVLGAVALAEGFLVVRKALDAPGFGMLARDFELYMDATRRWLGGGTSLNNGITIETFLYSLIGAIILLAIVNLIRRGTVR